MLAICDDLSHLPSPDTAREYSDIGSLGFGILTVSLYVPECYGTDFAPMAQRTRAHTASLHTREWKLKHHLPWAVEEQINGLT